MRVAKSRLRRIVLRIVLSVIYLIASARQMLAELTMGTSALFQIALDVLEAVQAKRGPSPEKVNELRRARPDLDHLPVGDLACEIFFAELARRQEKKGSKRSQRHEQDWHAARTTLNRP